MIFFKTFRRTSDQGTWRIGDKDPDDRARAHSRQADLLQCILVGKKAKIQVLGQWVTFSIKTDCRSWRPLTHQPFGKVSCDGTQPVVEQCYPRKFLVPPALELDCFYPSGSIFVKNVRSIVNKAMGLQCWHNPGPTLTAARGPGKMNLLKRQTSTVKLVDHVLSRSSGSITIPIKHWMIECLYAQTRRRMARERRGAESSVFSMETLY